MKFLLAFLIMFTAFISVMAQSTEVSVIPEPTDLYTWGVIILALYEACARLIPTQGNWSAVHLVFKIFGIIIPNLKRNPDGTVVKH